MRKYTREDIYDQLHSIQPITSKKLARRLKLPSTKRIGMLHPERSQLMKRMNHLIEIGAVKFIDYQGYVLIERIPKENDSKCHENAV